MTELAQLLVDGSTCRTKRRQLGLSQAELAKAAGVSRSSIQNLESGPGPEVRRRLTLFFAERLPK